eukprot:scaffold62006_cov33-Prasinocladus_malaysianus.AAC.2
MRGVCHCAEQEGRLARQQDQGGQESQKEEPAGRGRGAAAAQQGGRGQPGAVGPVQEPSQGGGNCCGRRRGYFGAQR